MFWHFSLEHLAMWPLGHTRPSRLKKIDAPERDMAATCGGGLIRTLVIGNPGHFDEAEFGQYLPPIAECQMENVFSGFRHAPIVEAQLIKRTFPCMGSDASI
jgi:hypothetical protein